MRVILISCEREKYPLAKICELESFINHVSQTFVTNLLVEKILLAKLCEWTEKLTLSPDFEATKFLHLNGLKVNGGTYIQKVVKETLRLNLNFYTSKKGIHIFILLYCT